MAEVREVERRRRRLNAAFKNAAQLNGMSDLAELQADYARHLCVLVSGFIERSVAEIVLAYAAGKSARQVVSFIEGAMKRQRNLDKERLLAVVGSLDARWRAELDAYVVDERQAALNSIVGLRNDIAHGGGSSVSLAQMTKYWTAVQDVVDKVAEVVLARPRPTVSGPRGARQRGSAA